MLRRWVLLSLALIVTSGVRCQTADDGGGQADQGASDERGDAEPPGQDLHADISCEPDCTLLDGTHAVCGDDGCGGSCGSCPQETCFVYECNQGRCFGKADDECCRVDGKYPLPGTLMPGHVCRVCKKSSDGSVHARAPDGLPCGEESDPTAENFEHCQAGTCCRPNSTAHWDRWCDCLGGGASGSGSQCEVSLGIAWGMDRSCLDICGPSCCYVDKDCPILKPHCAKPKEPWQYTSPMGRCVENAVLPMCWVDADCPKPQLCVGGLEAGDPRFCDQPFPNLQAGVCQ